MIGSIGVIIVSAIIGDVMKIRVKVLIKDGLQREDELVTESHHTFSDLYGEGKVDMIRRGNNLIFERDIRVSEATINAIKKTNASVSPELEVGDYRHKWVLDFFKGKPSSEISPLLGAFMAVITKLLVELVAVFNANQGDLLLEEGVVIIDDENIEHILWPKLALSGDITQSMNFNDENILDFVSGFNKGKGYLYAFNMFSASKIQVDPSLRIVEIAIAAEMAIKQFYAIRLPQLSIMLDKIQSPPMEQLYGSLYCSYFGCDFKFKKEMKKLFEIRNAVVHKISTEKVTREVALHYSHIVQQAISLLQCSLSEDESMLLENFKDIGRLQPLAGCRGQIVMTASQEERIQRGIASGRYPLVITSDYNHH